MCKLDSGTSRSLLQGGLGMTFTKKIFQLRSVRRHMTAPRVALFSFALLLAPTQPFRPGSAHVIERDDPSGGKETRELLRFYSVVRSQPADVRDSWAWAVSRTVLQESRRHSLDPLLVLAVISVESGFQDDAASADGARGLMQIQPDVARAIAEQRRSVYRDDKHLNHRHPNLNDPIVNIKLGVFYLHSLRQSFRDLTLALTAYNRGPTQVKNRLVEQAGMPLGYATKVLSTYHGYRRDTRQTD